MMMTGFLDIVTLYLCEYNRNINTSHNASLGSVFIGITHALMVPLQSLLVDLIESNARSVMLTRSKIQSLVNCIFDSFLTWHIYLIWQVTKLPCTSPSQSRNLSTGTTSWDVSLSFLSGFCSDTHHCSPFSFQRMKPITCWWSPLSDPVADHEIWF